MTYLKCAAVTVQKAVRHRAARRVLQQLLQKAQAAAQTKEEEAAKKASPPGKMMLRDRGLNDLAKFARRCAKKARRVTAKAHDVGAAVASLAVPELGWSAETGAACLAVQMAWRRHCARRQLVLKIMARADAMQDPLRARTVPGLPERPFKPVVMNVEILRPRVACAVRLATKLSALPLVRSWDVLARTWAELRRAYPQLDSDPELARQCQRLAAADEVIVEVRRVQSQRASDAVLERRGVHMAKEGAKVQARMPACDAIAQWHRKMAPQPSLTQDVAVPLAGATPKAEETTDREVSPKPLGPMARDAAMVQPSLTRESVAAFPRELQQAHLGELLFPRVLQLVTERGRTDHGVAAKAVGMLLELPIDEVIELVNSPAQLAARMNEACSALDGVSAASRVSLADEGESVASHAPPPPNGAEADTVDDQAECVEARLARRLAAMEAEDDAEEEARAAKAAAAIKIQRAQRSLWVRRREANPSAMGPRSIANYSRKLVRGVGWVLSAAQVWERGLRRFNGVATAKKKQETWRKNNPREWEQQVEAATLRCAPAIHTASAAETAVAAASVAAATTEAAAAAAVAGAEETTAAATAVEAAAAAAEAVAAVVARLVALAIVQQSRPQWKVVLEMSRYMTIPGAAVNWAEKSETLFKLAWAREDERRAAAGAG